MCGFDELLIELQNSQSYDDGEDIYYGAEDIVIKDAVIVAYSLAQLLDSEVRKRLCSNTIDQWCYDFVCEITQTAESRGTVLCTIDRAYTATGLEEYVQVPFYTKKNYK